MHINKINVLKVGSWEQNSRIAVHQFKQTVVNKLRTERTQPTSEGNECYHSSLIAPEISGVT